MVYEGSLKNYFDQIASERNTMQKRLFVISISALMIHLYLSSLATHAQSGTVIEVGNFSVATVGDKLPPHWKPLTFKKIERHTTYKFVRDNDTVVIKALERHRHPV